VSCAGNSLWNGASMKQLSKILMCGAAVWGMFLAGPRSAAQGPIVTGVGPEIEAHGGFEYIGMQVPTASSVPMYGADSGLTVGVTRHVGIRVDLGYSRASNVFDTGHHSDVLTYMAGPVFYPVRTRKTSPYVELLVGGARVTGPIPDGAGGFYRGYANDFAWAGGGGLEFRTAPEFAVRVGVDYLHTKYFDSNGLLAGQGNLRGVVSFTYYLGGRRR
jgi:opacity protein-like surface antigen